MKVQVLKNGQHIHVPYQVFLLKSEITQHDIVLCHRLAFFLLLVWRPIVYMHLDLRMKFMTKYHVN